jgi:hypothetical protein
MQSDNEGALHTLRAGNNAPQNDMPRIYPLGLMTDHPEYFEGIANQAVGGNLLNLALSGHIIRVIQWKQLERGVIATYSDTLPLDVADDLLVYSRRYGERGDSNYIRMLWTIAQFDIALDRMQKDTIALTPEQMQRLQELVDLNAKFKDKVVALVKAQPSQAKPTSPYRESADWWNDTLGERAFVESECLPILAEMAKIKLADSDGGSDNGT